MTTDGRPRRIFSTSRILAYSLALLGTVGMLTLTFGPSISRTVDCAGLGGTVQREAFSPSAYRLQGTPGSIYSCVDAAGVELKSYGLSGI